MALGEKVGELKGKIIGQRVIPSPSGGLPCMEVTFRGPGTLLGAELENTGTYVAEARFGGYFLGNGQGVAMTKDGEPVAWRGNGIGRLEGGKMQWRGSLFYEAQPGSKHKRLNGLVTCFEFETDEEGNCRGVEWEWR